MRIPENDAIHNEPIEQNPDQCRLGHRGRRETEGRGDWVPSTKARSRGRNWSPRRDKRTKRKGKRVIPLSMRFYPRTVSGLERPLAEGERGRREKRVILCLCGFYPRTVSRLERPPR